MTRKLLRNRMIELLIVFGIIALYFLWSFFFSDDVFLLVKLYSVATLFVIYAYFRLQAKLVIFNPINLFCFYYITVVIVNMYYLSTDFDTTPYLEKSTLRNSYIVLFTWSTFYYLVGIISILMGYSMIKTIPFAPIKYQSNEKMDPKVLYIVAYCLMLVGLANFMFNVLLYAGGNPITYLAQIAVRKEQFEESGTTFAYIFYYMGSYLLVFNYLRNNRKFNWQLFLVIFVGTILWISKGRIFLTLFYVLSFIAIFYFDTLTRYGKVNNKRYLFFLILVPLLAVGLFTFRVISSLMESGAIEGSNVFAAAGDIIDSFGYYLIDKGNLPNTAIFVKVIDSWKADHGYLYGQSLFSWIFNILPSALRPENYQPSAIVKNLWYSYIPTGNLPPTGVAEMYMNFGCLGPTFGMFLLGLSVKVFFNWAIRNGDYWAYAVMIWISLSFVMIYAKGEFDNLNLIYFIIIYTPFFLTQMATKLFTVKFIKNRESL